MDTENALLNQALWHKSKERKNYTIELKKDVVKYAKESSNNSAAKKLKLHIRIIRE